MQSGNGSVRAKRLRRNPLYQYKQRTGVPATTLAKLTGYRSVSAMYKAMRFERVPEYETAERIGKLVNLSAGQVIDLWQKERRRAA